MTAAKQMRLSRKARRWSFVSSASSSKTESIHRKQKSALCLIDGMLSTAAKACRRSSWSGQTAPGDAIAIAQVSGDLDDALREQDWPTLPDHIGHGYDPDRTPGFTELDTGVWLEDVDSRGGPMTAGTPLEGVLAHDYVIRPATTSWVNMIAVMRADWDSVVEK